MAHVFKDLGIIIRIFVGGGLFVLLFSASLAPQEVLYFDFDGDGAFEVIERRYGRIYLEHNEKTVFKTPIEWDVRNIMIGDFTNNGRPEIALYLWKKGSYGPSLPFWVGKNDNSYRQHLFLYEWENGVKPLWHSSNLPYINTRTMLDDFDGDGLNEIKVLERPYEWGKWGGAGQTVAVWQWDEWGFKKIWRSEKGRYNDLAL